MPNAVQTHAEVTNTKTRSLFGFLLITLAYLLAEVIYNTGVVRMLSSTGLTKETVEGMETVGKVMASIGITLFLSRLIPLRRLWQFGGLVVLLFLGLGYAVDQFIDSIPAESKIAGHWLGVYRVAVLERKVSNPDLFRPLAAPLPAQRVALVNIALLANEPNGEIRRAGESYIRKKVVGAYTDASMKEDFDRIWRAYSEASQRLRPAWNDYRRQHPKHSVQDFMANVKLNVFANIKYRQYCDTVIYAGNKELGLARVTMGDIPLFKSREALYADFKAMRTSNRQVAMDHYLPDETRADATLTRDFAASVFIPPISMTLSLFSILLNLASALGTAVVLVFAGLGVGTEASRGWVLRCASASAFALIFVVSGNVPFPASAHFSAAYEGLDSSKPHEWLWKSALEREQFILGSVGQMPMLVELADKLPELGGSLGAKGKKTSAGF